MKTWIIEPRDPFIARDGKPFGAAAGNRATSLHFPYPSTTTGGVRTRAGETNGVFDESKIGQVKEIQVRGALLVKLDDDGKIVDWFAPAPSDALLFATNISEQATVRQLAPNTSKVPAGALTNLPHDLQPVYLTTDDKRKPHGHAPRHWKWNEFEKWLTDASAMADNQMRLGDLGHDGPIFEQRAHVKIKGDKQTAEEGMLFLTRGLEFTHCEKDAEGKPDIATSQRLALALKTNADEKGLTVDEGLARLGGERRIVCWRGGEDADLLNSACPALIRQRILDDKRCRVVLLTSAHFIAGVIPSWLSNASAHSFAPKLVAIANSRYQVVSGWDFERVASDPSRRYGRPKPTRRLVPAGAVFWFDLSAGNKQQIEAWIDSVWMKCVSDADQDQKDGFGLAVLGTWPQAVSNPKG